MVASPEPASVAVIIPVWDGNGTGAKQLTRALASVGTQTQPVAEVIVVDDASPEPYGAGLAQAVEAASEQRVPARLIRLKHNSGPGPARNAGWEAAGDVRYVAFLDADDAWHPEKIARQVPILERSNAVMSAHAVAPDREMNADRSGVDMISFGALLFRNRYHTSSVMMRRDFEHRFPNERRCSEDYHLWLRATAVASVPLMRAELDRTFKPLWGAGGLSANLRAMTKGQLETYRALGRDGLVKRPIVPVLLAWSWLRHFRRVAVAWRIRHSRAA